MRTSGDSNAQGHRAWQRPRGGSKKFVQQGHSHFCARNVPAVREYGKRATCLREAAPAKAGNAVGGFFQHSSNLLSRVGLLDQIRV